MSAPGPDICGLAEAQAIEKTCRDAFDSMFHKTRASMTYDQWRLAFKCGFSAGRKDCQKDWADHMVRMSSAVNAARTSAGDKP